MLHVHGMKLESNKEEVKRWQKSNSGNDDTENKLGGAMGVMRDYEIVLVICMRVEGGSTTGNLGCKMVMVER